MYKLVCDPLNRALLHDCPLDSIYHPINKGVLPEFPLLGPGEAGHILLLGGTLLHLNQEQLAYAVARHMVDFEGQELTAPFSCARPLGRGYFGMIVSVGVENGYCHSMAAKL